MENVLQFSALLVACSVSNWGNNMTAAERGAVVNYSQSETLIL